MRRLPAAAPGDRQAAGRARLEVTADEVIVTTGSQQSLDIVARSLTTKRIAVESPVYGYAKLLFESLGHELVGLHLDPFRGIDLAVWTARSPASRRSRT